MVVLSLKLESFGLCTLYQSVEDLGTIFKY